VALRLGGKKAGQKAEKLTGERRIKRKIERCVFKREKMSQE